MTEEQDVRSGELPSRRSRRQAEVRERLIRSALRLFGERGFVATTVEDITNLADVGKGTFFNYFPTKEHVFAARADGQAEKVERFVAHARSSAEPMEELLHRLALTLSEGFEGSPAVFHSILVAVCSNEGVRRMLSEALERARRPLADLMSLGQERGEIRGGHSPSELAAGFQRAFFGTVFLWSLAPAGPLADCLRETTGLLWSTIRKDSA